MYPATAPARRLTRRSIALAALSGLALVLLTACAPAVTSGQHTTSPQNLGHHGSTATPNPAAALAPPKVRIPLTCAQLAPSATLNTVMEVTMTPHSEFSLPDLTEYAAVQDGALNCDWQGPVEAGGYNADYEIYAMPDATALWQKYSADGGLGEAYPASYVGPNAYGYCNSDSSGDPNEIGCGLDILVGSIWLHIDGYSVVASPPPVAQVQASFKSLFTTAISALSGATVAEPAWSDPAATTLSFSGAYGAVDQDAIAAAIGAPYAIEVDQPDFSLGGPVVAEMIPVGFRQDNGGGTGAGDTVTPATNFGLQVNVLPSGAWAFAQIKAAESGSANYATLSGLGTKAIIYSGAPDAFDAVNTVIVGTVGEHLYTIQVGDPGTAGTPNTVTMAKAAAAYVVSELSH